jgi:hypothetical protein
MVMRRFVDEPLAVFWRRFKVTLREAIPQIAEGDLRRSVIPALAQAFGNDKMARRLFTMVNPTMPALIEMVENFIGVEDQMTALRVKHRTAIRQVSEGDVEALTTAIEKIVTRVAKLECKDTPHGGTPKKFNGEMSRESNGPVICYKCGRSGHYRRNCQSGQGNMYAPGAQQRR